MTKLFSLESFNSLSEAISSHTLYLLPARKSDAHGQKDVAAVWARVLGFIFLIL
jgi:hypothetical protein